MFYLDNENIISNCNRKLNIHCAKNCSETKEKNNNEIKKKLSNGKIAGKRNRGKETQKYSYKKLRPKTSDIKYNGQRIIKLK